MEESGNELHIAVEPEGLAVGALVYHAVTKVIVPIVIAVLFIFPIVNINVEQISAEATKQGGTPVKSNATAEAEMKLNNYRVIDRAAGIYQIPVERAMEIIVSKEQAGTDRVISPIVPR